MPCPQLPKSPDGLNPAVAKLKRLSQASLRNCLEASQDNPFQKRAHCRDAAGLERRPARGPRISSGQCLAPAEVGKCCKDPDPYRCIVTRIISKEPRFLGMICPICCTLKINRCRKVSPRLPGVDRLEVDAAIGVHPVEKGNGSSPAVALVIVAVLKSVHAGPRAQVQKHTSHGTRSRDGAYAIQLERPVVTGTLFL